MSAIGKLINKDPISKKVLGAIGLGGGKGGASSVAPPAAPPAAPTLGDRSAAELAAEEERRKRAGLGRASTILTSTSVDAGGPEAKKLLLGAGI